MPLKKYLVFAIPAGAAAAAWLLWWWLPAAEVRALMAEGAAVETWTLLAYCAATLAVCATVHLTEDKLSAAALLLLLSFLAAREMDLHASITGTTVLRLSYYLNGGFTLEKAAALGALALFFLCVGRLGLRHGLTLRRDLRAGDPVAVAALAFVVTVVVSKILDRAVNILVQDFGLDVPAAASALSLAVEETLELALPLIVMAASAQYARAGWRALGGRAAAL